jgi:hypothetical protein
MTNRPLTEELERYAKLVMSDYPSDVCSRAKLEIDRLTRDLQAARAEATEVTRLRSYNEGLAKNVTELEAQNERLRDLLKGVAEYCSGDDRTLGAIQRLATIRNTVDRAMLSFEQQLRGGVDRGNAVLKEQAAMREEDPRPAEDIIREQRDEWRR